VPAVRLPTAATMLPLVVPASAAGGTALMLQPLSGPFHCQRVAILNPLSCRATEARAEASMRARRL
jgi:hypothetical protein